MEKCGRMSFLVVCALMVVCAFAASTPAAEPVYRLKYTTFQPPTSAQCGLMEQWCKDLEQKTNGRVKATLFAGGTLVPANQTYDGVVKGIADIGVSILAYSPGRHRLAEALSLPLGTKSGYQSSHVHNAYYQKFKPKELEDVKVFFLFGPGPFTWHTKMPINKIEDLKGVRIKSDANTSKVVMAAGGTPTTMSMAETYDAIKRGLADGVIVPIETLQAFRFVDVVKYSWENSGSAMSNSFYIVMNKQKWESLPKDIQEIMTKLNEEYFDKFALLFDKMDHDARQFALGVGHTFIKATPEQEAIMAEKVKPVLAKYIADMKEINLPGAEVVKFLQDTYKTTPVAPGK